MDKIEVRDEHAERLITDAKKLDKSVKVTFADGFIGFVPFSEIPEGVNSSDVVSIELPNPYEIIIHDSNGRLIELPWDFIRHYCDPTYKEKVEKLSIEGMKSLGKRIRNLREDKNMTQQKLALLAGIGRVTENRIEKGEQSPRYATLKLIADALQLNLNDLVSKSSRDRVNEFSPNDANSMSSNAKSNSKFDDKPDLVSTYNAYSKEKTQIALNKALEDDWETSIRLLKEAETLAQGEWRKELDFQICLIWQCIQKNSIGPLITRAEESIKMWDYTTASEILGIVHTILNDANRSLDFSDYSIRIVNMARITCNEADRWENTFEKKLDRTLAGVANIKLNLEELIEKDAKKRSFASKIGIEASE